MENLVNDNGTVSTFIKIAMVAFIALSIVNLYYSIKVNRKLLETSL